MLGLQYSAVAPAQRMAWTFFFSVTSGIAKYGQDTVLQIGLNYPQHRIHSTTNEVHKELH
jgi:hypothetical protein